MFNIFPKTKSEYKNMKNTNSTSDTLVSRKKWKKHVHPLSNTSEIHLKGMMSSVGSTGSSQRVSKEKLLFEAKQFQRKSTILENIFPALKSLHSSKIDIPLPDELHSDTSKKSSKKKKVKITLPKNDIKCSSVETYKKPCLSELESMAVLIVLANVTDKLAILKYLLPAISSEEEDHGYKSLELRFGTAAPVYFSLQPVTKLMKQLKHLQKQRTYVQDILEHTQLTLEHDNNYWPLRQAVDYSKKQISDEKKLETQSHVLWRRILKLKELLKSEVNRLERTSANYVHYLTDLAHITAMVMSAEHRYIMRWEAARGAQSTLCAQRGEAELLRSIEQVRADIELEDTVFGKIKILLQDEHEQVVAKMAEWEHKHVADVEKMDADIVHMKINVEVAQEECELIRRTLRSRARAVAEWRAARVAAARRAAAALRVQAWWRGVGLARTARRALAAAAEAREALATYEAESDAFEREQRRRAALQARARARRLRRQRRQQQKKLLITRILGAVLVMLRDACEQRAQKEDDAEAARRAAREAVDASQALAQAQRMREAALRQSALAALSGDAAWRTPSPSGTTVPLSVRRATPTSPTGSAGFQSPG